MTIETELKQLILLWEIEGHFPYFTKGFLLNNRKYPRRAKRAGKKNVN